MQTEGQKLSAGQKALFSPGGAAPEAFGSSEMNLFRYCGDYPVDGSDSLGLIENSENNIRRRDRIDELARSYEGSHKWDFAAKLDNVFKELVDKCSKFVHDVTKEAGATPTTVVDKESGKRRPATAEEVKTERMRNWRVVAQSESPQRGDLFGYRLTTGGDRYTGHAGIMIRGSKPEDVTNISVHGNDGVYTNPNQFVGHPDVVFRRYTGE